MLASTSRGRDRSVLSEIRLTLWEEVAPMSLHIGLVRLSLDTEPTMDILFDTSDGDRNLQPTACVAYHLQVLWLLGRWGKLSGEETDLGVLVRAG